MNKDNYHKLNEASHLISDLLWKILKEDDLSVMDVIGLLETTKMSFFAKMHSNRIEMESAQ